MSVLRLSELSAFDHLAERLLVLRNDNFVARPWGGHRMRELKGLPAENTAIRIGEAFEVAAFDADPEAAAHPSVVRLGEGSEMPLPKLLHAHSEALFGTAFVERHGHSWPLLPKTLDVAELLSVQSHPPGNTEVYVILAADRGATIRVGFATDVDGEALAARLGSGREAQRALLDLVGARLDADGLQRLLQPWLAQREPDMEALERKLGLGNAWPQAAALLRELHAVYWYALDLMNEIPVAAGQVIFNATPLRIAAAKNVARSAEVHALGNPQGREVVALEVRKPGPTFRAWDNVRFPMRDVDVDAAIEALNLERTEPAEFFVERTPIAGRAGVAVSVDTADFRLEHLTPTALGSVQVPAEPPHSLHVIDGRVSVYATDGVPVGRLERGDAALVARGVGAYRVVAEGDSAELLKIGLPQ